MTSSPVPPSIVGFSAMPTGTSLRHVCRSGDLIVPNWLAGGDAAANEPSRSIDMLILRIALGNNGQDDVPGGRSNSTSAFGGL